uniref:Uncharacterized protein n=1 Tax=Fagus sylvatica TaxID=28930 RepID=A0A2N9G455_FAGSY
MAGAEKKGGRQKQREQKGGGVGSVVSDQDCTEEEKGKKETVGHTARSDHSGHDLPHTEVRVCRAAPSKRKEGSEEEGEAALG